MNKFAKCIGMTAAMATGMFFGPAVWAQASFQGLGDLPGGDFYSQAHAVSADGTVVVGDSKTFVSVFDDREAFRWTAAGGMVGLGDLPGGRFDSRGLSTSANGAVVVGYSRTASGIEAFRWTAEGGMVGLGDLPGNTFYSAALYTSADGVVVVGDSNSVSGSEAFRWTAGDGMVGLGDLPGGFFNSVASAISADGAVIVGRSRSALGSEAFRWTAEGGMEGLGDLPGGFFGSAAFATSADGAVVVGQGNSASGQEAFRWMAGDGMVALGDFAGGGFNSFAFAVSADGAIVVGLGEAESNQEAFLWTAEDGMCSLRDLLVNDFGLTLTGWTLRAATGISADGRTIIGWGINPDGFEEGWIATIPAPIPALLDIKPGACPNRLNAKSRGVLVAALVGTPDFDPANIDPATVRLSRADGVGGSVAPLAGPPGPHPVLDDVAAPFDGDPCDCHDLEGDTIDDLSLKFDVAELTSTLELDETNGGSVVEFLVTGKLFDGSAFEARDCVTLVPPADIDADGDVDGADFVKFAHCFNRSGNPPRRGCPPGPAAAFDFDDDRDIDGLDFAKFAACFNKTGNPPRTLGCP